MSEEYNKDLSMFSLEGITFTFVTLFFLVIIPVLSAGIIVGLFLMTKYLFNLLF